MEVGGLELASVSKDWQDNDKEDCSETDCSESEHSADSALGFHKSCWKRDRRLKPLKKIPRLGKEQAAMLHGKMTEKLTVRELLLPDSGKHCSDHFKGCCFKYCSVLNWLPELVKGSGCCGKILNDFVAGMTVGVMAIPQSMSYANIAGLPYVYGLYAILVTTFVYSLVGNSKQLGVGPVAMVSLIVESGLKGVVTPEECPALLNNPDMLPSYELPGCDIPYVRLAFLCSLFVGIMNISAGFLNLGFLINFLAHPVISGFTSGAAIIIGLSQIQYIVGYKIQKSQYIHVTFGAVVNKIDETKWLVCVLGVTWIFSLAAIGYVGKTYKHFKWLKPLGPLIMCTIGICLCYFIPELETDYDVSIVGKTPSGFPPISIPDWDFTRVGDIMPTAISATLIGYMESIAIGKALAAKHGYEIDAGGEMVALGVTNLVGSMFSCYPVTGSFSRSAVNDATGATTQFAGMITAIIMACTLLFLTEVFYYLPKFALAAIVINSVRNLIAYQEFWELWHVKKSDCFIWLLSFIGTLFLGIQLGIGLAVVVSMFIIIYQTVRPQIVVLWRLPHTQVYSSIKTTTHGSFVPGVCVFRVGASIYFANSAFLSSKIHSMVEKHTEYDNVHYVVISMSSCSSVDSTGAHEFQKLVYDMAKMNIRVCFSGVGNRVWRTFNDAGLVEEVGASWFHETSHDAVSHCLAFDNSHIEEHTHFEKGFEHHLQPLTTTKSGFDVHAFGVHIE